MIDPDLLAAYQRTSYLVETPAGGIRLRIGEPNAALDALLDERGVSAWVFITAFNPRSQPLSAAENGRRHEELLQVVRPWETLPGVGVGDDGTWPPEVSLLVLGVTRAEARELGRRFGQLAVVIGRRGHAPELLPCAPEGAPPVS